MSTHPPLPESPPVAPDGAALRRKPTLAIRLLRGGLIILAILLLLLVTARVVLGGQIGRNLLESQLETREISGQRINMDGVSGDILKTLKVERLTISDAEGVWLDIQDAELDWRPLALLRRTIHVEGLTTGEIDYYRKPELPPSEATPESGFSNPFERYLVRSLAAPVIRIHETDATKGVALSLKGAADLGGEWGQLRIDAGADNGDARDMADIDLKWNRRTLLTGKAALVAPSQGFIASLAPEALKGDLKAVFTGEGDMENWQASGEAMLDETPFLTLSGLSEDSQVALDVRAIPSATRLPADLTARLGGPLNAHIDADIANQRRSDIVISLFGDSIDMRASGRANLISRRLIGEWPITARTHALSRLAGIKQLQAQSIAFDGAVRFDANSTALTGALNGDALTYEAYAAQELIAQLNGELKDKRVSFNLQTTASGLDTGNARLKAVLGETANIAATGLADLNARKITFQTLTADGAGVAASGKGALAAQGPMAFSGKARVSSLIALGAPLDGDTQLNWSLKRAASGDAPLIVALSGDASHLTTDMAALAALISDTASYQLDARLAANGALSAKANIQSGGAKAALDADMKNQILKARLNASLDSFAMDGTALQGLTLTATGSGPLNNLTIQSHTEINSATAGQVDMERADLVLNGVLRDEGFAGEATLDATANSYPLAARAHFATGDTLELTSLQANWADLGLNAAGKRRPDGALTGTFDVSGSLAALHTPGDIDAKGSLTGKKLDIIGALTSYRQGEFTLDRLDFSASGAPDNAAFKLTGKGAAPLQGLPAPYQLKIDGKAAATGDTRTLSANLTGNLDNNPFSSRTPVLVELAPGKNTVTAPLSLLGGKLDLKAIQSDAGLFLNTSADDISLGALAAMFGRENIGGVGAFRANWSGKGDTASGRYALTLTRAGHNTDDAAVMDVSLKGDITPDLYLASTLQATGEEGMLVSGRLDLPLIVANNLPRPDTETRNTRIDLHGQGRLEAVWALIGQDTIELDGKFAFRASDAAPIRALRPVGAFTLTDGKFEHAAIGSRISNISLDTKFDKTALHLLSASANGAYGGAISGQGTLYLDPLRDSALDLNFSEFMAVKRTGLSSQISGKIQVLKEAKGVSVVGDMNIDRADVDISKLGGQKRVPTVKVVFPDKKNGAPPPKKRDTIPAVLEIKLSAPQRIFVRGNGLEVEMSADILIDGDLADPQTHGVAKVVRGGFSLVGQRFDFTSGRVDLEGETRNALLNLEAARTSDGVRSVLGVRGRLAAPELVLSSTPSLPEDEILARLLFGRSPSQLSALEAAQLAAAVASLSGGGGGFTPLSDLQDALGVDRLTISQDASGNAQLATGKYLADDVYLELRSRANGASDIVVEWEAADHVQVGTEFRANADTRVTVEWKKDLN